MTVKKRTYEESMTRLEELISCMENNELGIDNLCDALEEVKTLVTQCREKLYITEEKVNKILNENKE